MNFKAALALLLEIDSGLPSGQGPLLIPVIVYLMGHIDSPFFDIHHLHTISLKTSFIMSQFSFRLKPKFIKTLIMRLICDHNLHD